LSGSITAGHASAGKGIDVGVRCRETVGEGLQKFNDLVLLNIRQVEIPDGHVLVLRDLGRRPTGYFLDCSWRAVVALDRILYTSRVL
jgi:hypothetical protein